MSQIQQTITVNAPAADVYAALTTGEIFAAMTGGAPASLSAAPGGAFQLFGGMIEGYNLDCVTDTRLVQAWRAKPWEPGAYSVVRFDLTPTEAGTEMRLTHHGYPDGQTEHLTQGWKANYLEPLKKHFG